MQKLCDKDVGPFCQCYRTIVGEKNNPEACRYAAARVKASNPWASKYTLQCAGIRFCSHDVGQAQCTQAAKKWVRDNNEFANSWDARGMVTSFCTFKEECHFAENNGGKDACKALDVCKWIPPKNGKKGSCERIAPMPDAQPDGSQPDGSQPDASKRTSEPTFEEGKSGSPAGAIVGSLMAVGAISGGVVYAISKRPESANALWRQMTSSSDIAGSDKSGTSTPKKTDSMELSALPAPLAAVPPPKPIV